MNKEQIKGVANEAAGDAKEKLAEVTNNPSLHERGHAQEEKGRAQQQVGNAREELKESDKELMARELREREAKRSGS